jgi:hypothetical protein
MDGRSRSGALMKPIVADILISSKRMLPEWAAMKVATRCGNLLKHFAIRHLKA